MNLFVEFLKENAYYGEEYPLESTNVRKFLDEYTVVRIGKGMNTRVFKVEEVDWVVKEGRWDLDVSFFENLEIQIPAQLTENFLKMFQVQFLPRPKEIKRQYDLYLRFVKYFGYFDEKSDYFHPEISSVFHSQQDIRNSLLAEVENIENKHNIKLDPSVERIFTNTSTVTHNYLPNEYLLYGRTMSGKDSDRDTYFIFQEFVHGELLHDQELYDLDKNELEQMILLSFLVLLMRTNEKLVPDLRPRHFVAEATDWFTNTDNLIISKDQVKFIDTRWVWETGENVVKRGILIPEMTVESVKKYLVKALKKYGELY
jgi:hypothetical protein